MGMGTVSEQYPSLVVKAVARALVNIKKRSLCIAVNRRTVSSVDSLWNKVVFDNSKAIRRLRCGNGKYVQSLNSVVVRYLECVRLLSQINLVRSRALASAKSACCMSKANRELE